ncbi:MAG TPA: hypothetical protein PKI37_00475, partial [Candidatus Cloacimonas sp.]|nr:hypothetical protein [Candidatus Cloacimonas sp.]
TRRSVPRRNDILVVLELTGRSTLRKNDILSFYKAQEMVDQEVCTPEKRRPRRFRVDREVCTPEKRRPRRFRVDQEVNPPEKQKKWLTGRSTLQIRKKKLK